MRPRALIVCHYENYVCRHFLCTPKKPQMITKKKWNILKTKEMKA